MKDFRLNDFLARQILADIAEMKEDAGYLVHCPINLRTQNN